MSQDPMEPLVTVKDEPSAANLLTEELSRLYGGGLAWGEIPSDRPYVASNFVVTMDGLTSFNIPGHTGGGDISGFNRQDAFVMGLLRALADGVVVGANALRLHPDHLWTPGYISPDHEPAYRELRSKLGKKTSNPLNVFVTGSGHALYPPRHLPKVFQAPEIDTLVLTTRFGQASAQRELAGTRAQIAFFGEGPGLDLKSALLYLRRERGIEVLLVEGGATLNGSMVAADVYDEVFLTVAPQIIGTDANNPRPPFVKGFARLPEQAFWHDLVSLKLWQDYIYKRYRRRPRAETHRSPRA